MREKLIKLLKESTANCDPGGNCLTCQYRTQADCMERITADYMISNGVTVQQWIPANEPPKDNTENQWVIYKVGGSYFHSTGYYDGKNWRSAITDLKIQIAGWMPLPQPAEGE